MFLALLVLAVSLLTASALTLMVTRPGLKTGAPGRSEDLPLRQPR